MTVAAIVDRLFRTYLYPPDAQPAQCLLDGAITDVATSIVFDNFVIPEDELLMAANEKARQQGRVPVERRF